MMKCKALPRTALIAFIERSASATAQRDENTKKRRTLSASIAGESSPGVIINIQSIYTAQMMVK
jgi:hypothetical protein